jgi:hypothetical protein
VFKISNRYTKGKGSKELLLSDPVYAIVLQWPETGVIELTVPTASASTQVSFLGYPGEIKVIICSLLLNP